MRRVFSFGAILLAVAMAPMTVLGSNQEMAEEIAGVLEDKNLIEGCDIGLKYQDETVWLTGIVDSAEKISAIQATVEGLDGVAKVVNQLEVEKVAEDASVQQVAGYQRSVVRRPAQLSDLGSEQIISDEVVAVNGVPVNQGQATPAGNSVVENGTQSVMIQGASMQSRPRPIQVSYGTTVQPVSNSVVSGAVPSAAPAPMMQGTPMPMHSQAYAMPANGGAAMRRKAFPAYGTYPNTASVQYPKRHAASAWPYIGPYYPYPQVPDGWRKVTLEWHDGYWHLDFDDGTTKGPFSGLFRLKP